MRTAMALFVDNCSACHGRDGKGLANMFPNLVDSHWQWGGSDEEIHTFIASGRQAIMPPHAQVLGAPEAVAQMVEYVRSLSGLAGKNVAIGASEKTFKTVCAACHGMDGTGNTALGAPDLTDGSWLYGSDYATIAKTISKGRTGVMPAQQERLGPARTRLLASLVASGKLKELVAARN